MSRQICFAVEVEGPAASPAPLSNFSLDCTKSLEKSRVLTRECWVPWGHCLRWCTEREWRGLLRGLSAPSCW